MGLAKNFIQITTTEILEIVTKNGYADEMQVFLEFKSHAWIINHTVELILFPQLVLIFLPYLHLPGVNNLEKKQLSV